MTSAAAAPSFRPMSALLRPVAWCAVAANIALLMLAVVHALETFGGYPPCELCLRQREVLWTVLALGIVGAALGRRHAVLGRIAVVAVGVAFAVGAAVAAYHAGVEWKWWPGPAACTGTARGGVSAADVAAVLSGEHKVHLVRCDDAAFRIAGLSLAGWNALACAGLATLSALALVTPDRRSFSRRV